MRIDELDSALSNIKDLERFFDTYPPLGDTSNQEWLDRLNKLRTDAMVRFASNALRDGRVL